MNYTSRLPRKVKKVIKLESIEKWRKFLEESKDAKMRAEHIDKLFMRDYTNVYHIFHKSLKCSR